MNKLTQMFGIMGFVLGSTALMPVASVPCTGDCDAVWEAAGTEPPYKCAGSCTPASPTCKCKGYGGASGGFTYAWCGCPASGAAPVDCDAIFVLIPGTDEPPTPDRWVFDHCQQAGCQTPTPTCKPNAQAAGTKVCACGV